MSVLVLLVVFWFPPTAAPPAENCFQAFVQTAPPLRESFHTPTGLVVRHYDTNGNGTVDLTTNTPQNGGILATFPLFYVWDLDEDGFPDLWYQDQGGEGLCRDFLWHIMKKGVLV